MNETQTNDIIALALKLVPPSIIALKVKVPPHVVYKTLFAARAKGVQVPKFSSASRIPDPSVEAAVTTEEIVVPLRLKSLLTSEAQRQGKTPAEVAMNLLEAGLLKGRAKHG